MPQETLAKRPILVTGSHRSGTTWTGKMLAAGGNLAYISEPLNVWHRPGILKVRVRRWYTYICEENEAVYLPAFQDTLALRYQTGAELIALRSVRDIFRMGRDWLSFTQSRARQARPLLKDPFAVFSASWFARRLDCQVVILVRHPAAIASSLKRLEWPFNFVDLLQQDYLMRDWLAPHRADMEKMARYSSDVITQSGLLWRMIYGVVAQLRQQHPEFHLVRHEDLSLSPLEGFRALYAALDIPFSDHAKRAILDSTSAENPPQTSTGAAHAVKLDSRANVKRWQQHLSAEEIARLRVLTEDAASQFYSEEDWQ